MKKILYIVKMENLEKVSQIAQAQAVLPEIQTEVVPLPIVHADALIEKIFAADTVTVW
ncbi:MAG: hypothetical protein SGI71_06810 [Verrucomicrobiota bacterium]|nr:hypothetical protein [Verrucomicrobiota bacterium]